MTQKMFGISVSVELFFFVTVHMNSTVLTYFCQDNSSFHTGIGRELRWWKKTCSELGLRTELPFLAQFSWLCVFGAFCSMHGVCVWWVMVLSWWNAKQCWCLRRSLVQWNVMHGAKKLVPYTVLKPVIARGLVIPFLWKGRNCCAPTHITFVAFQVTKTHFDRFVCFGELRERLCRTQDLSTTGSLWSFICSRLLWSQISSSFIPRLGSCYALPTLCGTWSRCMCHLQCTSSESELSSKYATTFVKICDCTPAARLNKEMLSR